MPRVTDPLLPGPGLDPRFSDSQFSIQGPRLILLKLQLVSESSGGLVKLPIAGPPLRVSDSVGLGGLEILHF